MNQEYPGYSTVVTPDARAMREAMTPDSQSKLAGITDQLALNPRAFQSRTEKEGQKTYVYRHPDPSFQITYQLDEGKEPKEITFIHFAEIKFVLKQILFISYSHKDSKALEELKKFLKFLEKDEISIWDDHRIDPGDQWKVKIRKALNDARAAVLLISQDFLDSKFIETEELPILLEKARNDGLKILWIPVRPSTIKEDKHPIWDFQALVENPEVALSALRKAKREQQLVIVRKKIGTALGLG